MDNKMGAGYAGKELEEFLANNADRMEEFRYTRQFLPEELDHMKEDLSSVTIQIDDLQESKKEVMKEFSDALKPLNESLKKILVNLRTRSEQVTENCYVFHDYDDRQVGYYNAKGDLVNSRPMRPQEMQGNIFKIRNVYESQREQSMTGTND